jgi:cbb3-type cytochrome c oxidase subunit III
MNMPLSRYLVSSLMLFGFMTSLETSDAWSAPNGKTLFASCSACHGQAGEGNAAIGAPNIAGADAWYLERQLSNFSSGLRGASAGDKFGAQMRGAAAVLKSDAERNAVAAYVAALPKTKPPAAAKADLANGSTQFNGICSSCHASHGRGNQALGTPNLVGIDPVYMERQINAFRSGARGAHKDDKWGAQMRVGAGMLPDAKSVRDVVAYIGTLKP